MAEPVAGPQAPPEHRLREAGFVNEVGFWREPGGERRLFSKDDATARLESGDFTPLEAESWPGVRADTAAAFRVRSDEEIDRMLGRNQPAPEPPPLPSWAEPWAEVIADQLAAKLRPVIREVVRAELRKAAKP